MARALAFVERGKHNLPGVPRSVDSMRYFRVYQSFSATMIEQKPSIERHDSHSLITTQPPNRNCQRRFLQKAPSTHLSRPISRCAPLSGGGAPRASPSPRDPVRAPSGGRGRIPPRKDEPAFSGAASCRESKHRRARKGPRSSFQ